MGRFQDLTGKRFGKWTVLRRSAQNYRIWPAWDIRCDCGFERSLRGDHLRNGLSTCCRSCAQRADLDLEKIKRQRQKGLSWAGIAKGAGYTISTVKAWAGGDGIRPNWMRQHFNAVRHRREAGQSWAAIIAEMRAPYVHLEAICVAYSRERRRWLQRQFSRTGAIEVHRMTREGLSAREIAERLGVAERTVVRLRGVEIPQLDMPRIRKLQARGLSWQVIWSRLGRPVEDSQVLRAWFELLDVEEALAA